VTQSINWPATAMRAGVVVAAIILTAFMVLSGSRAAFSGTTSNSANSFAAGTVTITDDDSGSALFSLTGLKPNDTNVNCIEVEYTGSLDSNVRLYAENLAGTGLDDYLTLTIERGTPGLFGNCGTFVASETVFDSTNPVASTGELAAFAANHTTFANGAGTWNGATTNDTQTYRFTATLQNDNAANGLDATVDFTWEAQNT